MRQMVALLMMMILAAAAAAQLEDYGSAGSEDIYLQGNSVEDGAEEEQYLDIDDEQQAESDPKEEEEAESDPKEESEAEPGNNIEAIGEDESSCEYSCPRYYRPVCVSRNDQLITYATPCEFFNQLRCANVARKQGKDTPTFQLLYHNACRQNTN